MSSPSPSSNRIRPITLVLLGLTVVGPPIAAGLLFTPFVTHNLWITVLLVGIYEIIVFILSMVVKSNLERFTQLMHFSSREVPNFGKFIDQMPIIQGEAANFDEVDEDSTPSEPFNPPAGITLLHTLTGPTDLARPVAWSPDGQLLAFGSNDPIVWLWNSASGKLLHTLKDHTGAVLSVAWSPNGKLLASGSKSGEVRLWNPLSNRLLHILESHVDWVWSVAWSPDGNLLASGSDDTTVRLWNPTSGKLLHTLESHTARVCSIAWSPDGNLLASGFRDTTVRLWNPTSGKLLHTLEGHTDDVYSIAWSPDGNLLASGSHDKTVRLWNPTSGKLLRTLEGHTDGVWYIAWSPDGELLACSTTGDREPFSGAVYFWSTNIWEPIAKLPGLQGLAGVAWHPHLPLIATSGQRKEDIFVWELDIPRLLQSGSPETLQYTNAKVVLLGDSGVGKSGLGLVLSGQPYANTESTHGRRIWTFDSQEVALDERRKEMRETLLWDLAGQPGYRLIHQLYLNEVTVALVVFDAHSEIDPFAGVRHWDTALRQAQRVQGSAALPLKKFLVAARTDRGGIGVSPERMRVVVRELGFDGYFETSAKERRQIPELREAIDRAIDWEALPKVSSTALFQQIKQFLVDEKQRARRLISTVKDLYSAFLNSKDAPQETPELAAQFETCIGRVESAGLIKWLSFGNLVLLQPELLDAYASALVNAARDEPDGLGSVAEDEVRAGKFRMPDDERIHDVEQEKLLLIAMSEDLLRRELVLREEGMLVFPSQSTKENPDLPDPKGKAVMFEFQGPVLNIYATLAVRLARSGLFKKKELWKNAITYKASVGGTCGVFLRNKGEGQGELTLFFDEAVSRDIRRIFEEYAQLHLVRRALPDGFNVHHVLACGSCNTIVADEVIQRRKERNLDWLNCPVCDTRVSLIEREQQRTEASSASVQAMDRAADSQRDLEAAKSILQGKIETEDFDVFLCHHGVDKPAVKRIGEQLKERGILPWLDEWELPPGRPWQPLLEKQIGKVKAAAVFVGKNGRGPWQDRELYAFLLQFANGECPVIPVILPDCEQIPDLPLFLRAMTWVDFRVQDPDPMERLLWGITGKREVGKNGMFRGRDQL